MPATAPATQPSRRLGVLLVDESRKDGGQELIKYFGGNLVINKVIEGSRAEKMGLKLGDAIKGRINGKGMKTVPDVVSAVREAELLKIEVIREKKSLTLEEKEANE